MNKEAYLELADALESGQYKQARGVLGQGDAFCVAGVACEVFGPRLGVLRAVESGSVVYANNEHEWPSDIIAPTKVKRYLDEDDAFRDTVLDRAMSLNDFDMCTFPEIATFIRENVEEN